MVTIHVGDTVRLKGDKNKFVFTSGTTAVNCFPETRINVYWFSNVDNRLYSMEVPYGVLEKA